MIRVLVVEDSAVLRQVLVHILQSDPEIQIVGTAANGEDALAEAVRTRPDVITMDIHMPGMNGFDATRRIMERQPTPIVIVSGTLDPSETSTAFRALESGALAILLKPGGVGGSGYGEAAAELIQTVKTMSEVKVVRRWVRKAALSVNQAPRNRTGVPPSAKEVAVVAIGASTGGPQVLQIILSQLPANFGAPLLVVQHIASGFTPGFVEWLAQSSTLPVHLATHGETILPGHVYLAPDGWHLKAGSERHILLSQEEPENGLRPSVSTLFRSVARVYAANAIGVLLSGMGKDGAQELKLLKDLGAITIAQDRNTSVVHGMPGEAIKLGATTHVLSQEKIATVLANLVNNAGTALA